jgi:acetylglutamate kinase
MHMEHKYAIASAVAPIVVKYGGNAMPLAGHAGDDPTLAEVVELWRSGVPIVLVHGGGPEIDAALAVRSIVTERIDGMRVTDGATLAITEAVLCGTLNKRIVRACAALGAKAVGISGQDGGMLIAEKMRGTSGADLGYVGEIVASDPALLRTLLGAGFLPVVSPIAVSHDAASAFNVNADLAAAAIAGAVDAQAFVAVTNVRRVLRDADNEASAIEFLTPAEAETFAASEACRAGMKPKMRAAAFAVASGAAASFICAAGPGAIRAAVDRGEATVVRRPPNLH